MAQGETRPPDAAREWNAYAVYTLGFLTLISAFNYLDRGIFGLALPLIKRDIHASDTQLALVSGLAFAVVYSLVGLPVASLADRRSRRDLITIGFAFWSVMTGVTALISSIGQLAAARLFLGAGEACGIAPSNSMVSDLFRESRRPLALGIFGIASSISSFLFYPVIGWIGQRHGWRAMFSACALPGLALAILFRLTVREPARGAAEGNSHSLDAHSLRESVRFLVGSRSYLLMLAGAMFMGASVYAASTWHATFLWRVHHLRIGQVASSIGRIQGVFGATGILLGGILTDALGRRDARWRLRLPALACLLAAPAEALFLLGNTRLLWTAGLALTSLFTLLHQAPIFAAAMSVARVRMRAVAIALLVLASGLLGQVVGPFLVGFLNDRLAASLGSGAVRYSLPGRRLRRAGRGCLLGRSANLRCRPRARIARRVGVTTEEASGPRSLAPCHPGASTCEMPLAPAWR